MLLDVCVYGGERWRWFVLVRLVVVVVVAAAAAPGRSQQQSGFRS